VDKESKINRGERRYKTSLKQKQRCEYYSYDTLIEGKLRDSHLGCGCIMCKPYKHGKDHKLKPSDRKKIIEE